eukprot:Awhi_evm1s9384
MNVVNSDFSFDNLGIPMRNVTFENVTEQSLEQWLEQSLKDKLPEIEQTLQDKLPEIEQSLQDEIEQSLKNRMSGDN